MATGYGAKENSLPRRGFPATAADATRRDPAPELQPRPVFSGSRLGWYFLRLATGNRAFAPRTLPASPSRARPHPARRSACRAGGYGGAR